MLPENVVFIGVAISIIGYYFYFKNIFKGTTKPNLVSWFLWMLGPFVGTFLQIKAGANLSVLPVFIAGFGPLLVIVVSLFNKKAYWKITFFDIICGLFSVLALVIYALTHRFDISIFFAILSDFLASVPTLVKSWKFPETETASVYFMGIFSNILGLLVIRIWTFPIYSFGIYLVLMNIAMAFFIYRKRIASFFN